MPPTCHMAIDTLDALDHPAGYDEFILLSADTDLTPVLLRLRAHNRNTVVVRRRVDHRPTKAIADGMIDAARFAAVLAGDAVEKAEAPAARRRSEGAEPAGAPAMAADRNDIEALARKVHAATNVPMFSPRTFADLFRVLTQEIGGMATTSRTPRTTSPTSSSRRGGTPTAGRCCSWSRVSPSRATSSRPRVPRAARRGLPRAGHLPDRQCRARARRARDGDAAQLDHWPHAHGRQAGADGAATPPAATPPTATPTRAPSVEDAAKEGGSGPPPRHPARVQGGSGGRRSRELSPSPKRPQGRSRPPRGGRRLASRARWRSPRRPPVSASRPGLARRRPQGQRRASRDHHGHASVPSREARPRRSRSQSSACGRRVAAGRGRIPAGSATSGGRSTVAAHPAGKWRTGRSRSPPQGLRRRSRPRRGRGDALESSILAAIAQAVDVLVDDNPEPPRRGTRGARSRPRRSPSRRPHRATSQPEPPPDPEPSPGGGSEDIGDEIQRIIASYSRARTQSD